MKTLITLTRPCNFLNYINRGYFMPPIERDFAAEAQLKDEYFLVLSRIQNLTARLSKRRILIKRLSFLTQYAEIIDVNFIIYDFHRTEEQQLKRYRIGRTEPGSIITGLDGIINKSKHQSWHAFDILILGPQNRSRWNADAGYRVLGKFWESLGGVWGGRWYIDGKTKFNDVYHFQV